MIAIISGFITSFAGFWPTSVFYAYKIGGIPARDILDCLVLCLSCLSYFIFFPKGEDRDFKKSLFLFLLPMGVSLGFHSFFFLVPKLGNEQVYIERTFSRSAHILILSVSVLIQSSFMQTKRYAKLYLRGHYTFLILLMLVGVWQWLSFYRDVPFPITDARTFHHSVGEGQSFLFAQRLTSFCIEPSFFAPYIIEFIILSQGKFFLFTLLGFFHLIFNFSMAAYAHFGLLMFGYGMIFLWNKRISKVALIFISVLILGPFLYPQGLILLFKPIAVRLEGFLNIEEHARLYILVQVFQNFLQSNGLNIIFGNGIASFTNLKETVGALPSGEKIHDSSNTLLIDSLFELGLFGVLSHLLFLKSLFPPLKSYSKGWIYALFILGATFYRGDYVSFRFWQSLLVLYFLRSHDKKSI